MRPQTYASPSIFSLTRGPRPGFAPTTDPATLAILNAQFDQEYPFAPTGFKPDWLTPAPIPDDQGLIHGTTGGLLPFQPAAPAQPPISALVGQTPQALPPGAISATPSVNSPGGTNFTLAPGAPENPAAVVARWAAGRQARGDALSTTFGSDPWVSGLLNGRGGRSAPAPFPTGVDPTLTAAVGVDNLGRQLAAGRDYRLNIGGGQVGDQTFPSNLPSPEASPEVNAGRLAYLKKSVVDQTAPPPGLQPSAPQTPTFDQLVGAGRTAIAQTGQPQRITTTDSAGNPVSFLWDPHTGNPQRIDTKPEKPIDAGLATRQIGGRTYTVDLATNKYFDEKGTPVIFGDTKPVDPIKQALAFAQYQSAAKAAQETETSGKNIFEGEATFDSRLAALRQTANFYAAQLGYEPLYPATKPGGTPAATVAPASAAPGADLPILTPAQATAAPKGTRFRTTDGRTFTK